MLTVDFHRFPVNGGDQVLDLGCGAGRHAFELYRRGADVVAFDQNRAELLGVAEIFAGMRREAQVPEGARARVVEGDALNLPFRDGEFDRIIAAEVLEHIHDDERAIAELVRVLRPGGTLAVTVPRWLPEKVCWALSERYHEVEGGHVRIYKASELAERLERAGLTIDDTSYAHALHAPYWWLKCAVGVDNETNPLVTAYHRLLVWDITDAPRLTRTAERVLNPVIGKSVVLYATKPYPAAGRG